MHFYGHSRLLSRRISIGIIKALFFTNRQQLPNTLNRGCHLHWRRSIVHPPETSVNASEQCICRQIIPATTWFLFFCHSTSTELPLQFVSKVQSSKLFSEFMVRVEQQQQQWCLQINYLFVCFCCPRLFNTLQYCTTYSFHQYSSFFV